MKKIGIIGTGTMGTDIAYLAAANEFDVALYDNNKYRIDNSLKIIHSRLERYKSENRISKTDIDKIISRLSPCMNKEDLCDIDIAIECVTEDLLIKQSVFTQLDNICEPGTIFASNTSSISITDIAKITDRPESCVGIHFLIPAHIMPIVEIIPGFRTTRETVSLAIDVVKKMGKAYVEAPDYPGFILNRTLLPMINEAITLLFEGAGTIESVDKIVKFGLNLKMGPLELADLIGLDVILAILEQMFQCYGDNKYIPCPLLKKYVSAGHLGKKSGRGFYRY